MPPGVRLSRGRHAVALALALALLALPAAAERIGVRFGEHPGHGRVVFDWPARTGYQLEEAQGRVVLRFDQSAEFDWPSRLPRNVVSISAEGDTVSLAIRPGARARVFRVGERVVLDVLDPSTTPVAAAGATGPAAAAGPPSTNTLPRPAVPAPRPVAEPSRQVTVREPPARRPVARPNTVPADPAPPALAEPPAAAAAPATVPAAPVPPPEPAASLPARGAIALRVVSPPGRARALWLPLPQGTGLAVFRRGESLLAVLDSALPLDLTALRGDPVFSALEASYLPEATVLQLRLAAPAVLLPRREGSGWTLEPAREALPGRSILPSVDGEALALRVAQPGRVVTLDDPETGLPLLVGAVVEPEQSSPQLRRLPRAELLPTLLGAALLARGDGVVLRAVAERFLVSGAGEGSTVAAGASSDALAMTRMFDLTPLSPQAAQRRLQSQQAGLAATPPLQRGFLRRDAGEALLGLGLPQEAQAMLRLAFQEDPRAAADPRSRALQAAAAVLAGRLSEAAALDGPGLPQTDETTLWRALLRAARGERAAAAPDLAATLPLLLSYPDGLRARLLAPVAEALAEGGETEAAGRLLRNAGALPGLDYARGRLAEAQGKVPDALAAYEETARGRDRLARSRALRRSVELRLASGALDPAGAAAALDAAIFAWRGDGEEADTRQRVAALRQQAGDGRGALAVLQETALLFPDRTASLRPALREALLSAMEHEAPLTAIALAEANRDLLPTDAQGSAVVSLLADRLVALDLPERAAVILERGMQSMAGAPRAALGARLAALRLGEGDAAGATAALTGSTAPSLPPGLAEERTILLARAMARGGQEEAAIAALRGLGAPGLPVLADLLAARRDWAGAADALLAQAALPGEVDDARRQTVVRAAAFAALAGETAKLAALRAAWVPRLGDGPLAQAFLTLTADPVRGLDDLPRLQRELDLFRGFPTRLEALRADASFTR